MCIKAKIKGLLKLVKRNRNAVIKYHRITLEKVYHKLPFSKIVQYFQQLFFVLEMSVIHKVISK